MAAVAQTLKQEARLPIFVRGISDLVALRMARAEFARLPKHGVKVAIPGLDPLLAARFEDSVRRYVAACGCAEGAIAFLLVATGGIAVAAGELGNGMRVAAAGWALAASLPCAVLAGGIAKVVGIAMAKRRFAHRCDLLIDQLGRNLA